AGQRALDDLPAGVRVFVVPAAPLPFARLERAALRFYRRLRPHRAVRATSVSQSAPTTPILRAETVERANVRWSFRSPRTVLRAFWVWREVAQLERWSRAAFAEGRSVARRGVHRAVVTSGPPHWTHVAGKRLAAVIGVPYVMDMRDPWSLFERLMEQLA